MTFWIWAALPFWIFAIIAIASWFFDWCQRANAWWGAPFAFALGVPFLMVGVVGIVFILFAPVIQ